MRVDPRAASAFASSGETYERGRPSYPNDLVDSVAREFGLAATSTVLDLGAGTEIYRTRLASEL